MSCLFYTLAALKLELNDWKSVLHRQPQISPLCLSPCTNMDYTL